MWGDTHDMSYEMTHIAFPYELTHWVSHLIWNTQHSVWDDTHSFPIWINKHSILCNMPYIAAHVRSFLYYPTWDDKASVLQYPGISYSDTQRCNEKRWLRIPVKMTYTASCQVTDSALHMNTMQYVWWLIQQSLTHSASHTYRYMLSHIWMMCISPHKGRCVCDQKKDAVEKLSYNRVSLVSCIEHCEIISHLMFIVISGGLILHGISCLKLRLWCDCHLTWDDTHSIPCDTTLMNSLCEITESHINSQHCL